jgi:hypothetical protein
MGCGDRHRGPRAPRGSVVVPAPRRAHDASSSPSHG